MLTSGPPELPGLIAASVWMKSEIAYWLGRSPRTERPLALTIPAGTGKSRPSGVPIASTQSPMRAGLSSPRHAVGVGDDVVVGEDVAVLGDDETGAAGLTRLLAHVGVELTEEVLEAGGHAPGARAHRAVCVALGVDRDHGRRDVLRDL